MNEYWENILKDDALRPEHSVAIIDGHHYVIEDENSVDPLRGFGGDKFTITFNDGKVVITTNLWSQGKIPEDYVNLFPNNADFDWKWVVICNSHHLVPKHYKV